LGGRFDRSLDLLGMRYICLDKGAFNFGRDLLAKVLLQVGYNHLRPFRGQSADCGGAQSGCSTGDDGDNPVQIHDYLQVPLLSKLAERVRG
jgi:hypothetical protein